MYTLQMLHPQAYYSDEFCKKWELDRKNEADLVANEKEKFLKKNTKKPILSKYTEHYYCNETKKIKTCLYFDEVKKSDKIPLSKEIGIEAVDSEKISMLKICFLEKEYEVALQLMDEGAIFNRNEIHYFLLSLEYNKDCNGFIGDEECLRKIAIKFHNASIRIDTKNSQHILLNVYTRHGDYCKYKQSKFGYGKIEFLYNELPTSFFHFFK